MELDNNALFEQLCVHDYQPSELTAALTCRKCQHTIAYTALLEQTLGESPSSDARRAFHWMYSAPVEPLIEAIHNPTFKPQLATSNTNPLRHKASADCAMRGCKGCIEKGNELDRAMGLTPTHWDRWTIS